MSVGSELERSLRSEVGRRDIGSEVDIAVSSGGVKDKGSGDDRSVG